MAIFSDNGKQDVTAQAQWSSSNAATATINAGTGLAQARVPGTTTILASYNGASISTTLTVTPATVTGLALTPASPSIAKGTTKQFIATATFSDSTTQDVTAGAVWSSSNAAVAAVGNATGNKGLATGAGKGAADISAVFQGASGTTALTVTDAVVTSVEVTPANPSIPNGTSESFKATAIFSDSSTQDVTAAAAWSSATPAVATVGASTGVAQGLSVGQATIAAAYSGFSGSTALSVTAATLATIQVTPATPSVAKGLQQQFTATGIYTDNSSKNLTASVTWASSAAGVATISNAVGSTGLASTVATGSATITATDATSGKAGSTVLTVTAATLASIDLTPINPSVAKNLQQQFTATGVYSDSSTKDLTAAVTWASSDTAVASISNAAGSKGLASSAAVGHSTISATDAGSGKSASTTLTVTAATLTSIQVTPANPSIAKGTQQQFTATGIYSDNSTKNLTASATWSSSATAVATISNAAGTAGLASTVATGSATISATDSASGKSGATLLTVTAASLATVQVTPANPAVAKGAKQQFTAAGVYTDSTTKDLTTSVTWSSSNSAIATISNAAGSVGLASSAGVGQSTITATDVASGKAGTTTLTVNAATLSAIQVTPANPSVAKGLQQQFIATGVYTDSSTKNLTTVVSWSSSATSVATISNAAGSNGLASTVNAGQTTVNAIDTASGTSGSTTLTVTAATLASMQIAPVNPSVAKGVQQQFTATGTYTDSSTKNLTSTVNWSSSVASVATVSNTAGSNGLASAVGTGQTTIKAVDSASGISVSTTLTVTPAVIARINVMPTHPSVPRGTNQQLTATAVYTDGSTQDLTGVASWSTSDAAVADVSNAAGTKGLVAAKTLGPADITATDPSSAVAGKTTVTVTAAVLQAIQVSPASAKLAQGFSLQYAATGIYSDNSKHDVTAGVTWASSNGTAATISAAGLATAPAAATGVTTISAVASGITGSTTLTADASKLQALQVTPTAPHIPLGSGQQFKVTGTFGSGASQFTQDLTSQAAWTSSNTAVATVGDSANNKGLAASVPSAAPGSSADIKATVINSTNPAPGVSAFSTLSIDAAVLQSLVISPQTATAAKGTDRSFSASGTYSDGQTRVITDAVTWSSSDPGIATVSTHADAGSPAGGVATAVAEGKVFITATDPQTQINASATFTVTPAVLNKITVTPATPSVALGVGQQFTATGTYSDSSTEDLTATVVWASSSGAVARISNAAGSQGLASTLAVGSTQVSAAMGSVSSDASAGSAQLTVTSATLTSITIAPSPATVPKGDPLQFVATGHYTDGSSANLTDGQSPVTWSSADDSVAVISNAQGSRGLATGLLQGSVNITATASDGSGISGLSSLTVTPSPVSSVSVTPSSGSIPAGYDLPYTATAFLQDGSSMDVTSSASWTSLNPSVAKAGNGSNDKGIVKGVVVGTTSVIATYSGHQSNNATANVTAATLVSIDVTPKTSTISRGKTLQFKAVGTFDDGSLLDITHFGQVTWASNRPSAATIDPDGLATAGSLLLTTTISASSGGMTGSTTLKRVP